MKFDKIKNRKANLEGKIKSELKKDNPNLSVITDSVYEFEKNNLDTIEKLRRDKKVVTKKISGALKQCINTHGPITKEYIGSATKRVYGNLLTVDKVEDPQLEHQKRIATLWKVLFLILAVYNIATLILR